MPVQVTSNKSSDNIIQFILPRIAGMLVLSFSILILVGWSIDNEVLKKLVIGSAPVNPVSAVLFILLASILLLTNSSSPFLAKITKLLVLICFIIAIVKIVSLLTGIEFYADQFLFSDKLNGDQMAPNTAINFFLCAIGFGFNTTTGTKTNYISQLVILIALGVSVTAFIGHVYAAQKLAGLPSYVPMALPAAILFTFLCIGLLLNKCNKGFMAVISSNNIGGKISRILLPVTILIPFILGWLLVKTQQLGLLDLQFSIALVSIISIFSFTILIWLLSKSLNHTDEERKKAEDLLLIAKLEAEQAKKTQEQFLANMSHEIRTPLNGIIGMAHLLKETKIDDDQLDYIDTIYTSTTNLLVIINDLLDIAKINSGKITFEAIDFSLNAMLKPINQIFKLKSLEKGISFSYEIDNNISDIIIGDPVRINQILTNLINNAIKFTEEGKVVLQIKMIERNEKQVRLHFSVTDTGIGIAKSQLNYVFDTFTQATTDTTRKYGGTGLGLSISKQLVELMGGRIYVSSTLGVGSVFSFEITVSEGDEQKLVKNTPVLMNSEKSLKGVHILVADDNLINQKVASLMLSKIGALVETVSSGTAVLQVLEHKKVDIVLMDIEMPEMNGIETAVMIRKSDKAFAKIPIIALTASAFSSEKAKCIAAGMNDYVTKPFNPEILSNIILSAIEQLTQTANQ